MSDLKPRSLAELPSWYRIQATLTNVRAVKRMNAHPLSIMQAILKGVHTRAFTQPPGEPPYSFFHIVDQLPPKQIQEGMEIPLQIFLFRSSEEQAEHWRTVFKEYVAGKTPEQNYRIKDLQEVEKRNAEQVVNEAGQLPTEGEICLEFLTPLRFKSPKNQHRVYIGKKGFIKLFEKRFSRLFGTPVAFEGNLHDFTLLPYYWKYTEYHHQSTSQPGTRQYIKGARGPLYIKGDFSSLLPFLVLGSEIHIGSKLSNGQGYYRLREKSMPWFDRRFPNKQALRSTVIDVLEGYDSISKLNTEQAESVVLNEEQFVDEIYLALKEDDYTPTPHQGFWVKKRDGSSRLVEHPKFKELVIQKYLSRTIYKIFDRFFEKESIGFRKGYSRKKSRDMVKTAIRDGYQYVVESDIEDFFPSVDLEILKELLDAYLPSQDVRLRSILHKSITNGYELNGAHHKREMGLAQGSPLSPILANLYLDAFDEAVADWKVKMVRYADDFIIMTRTYEEAEEILSKTKTYLSELGLRLKKEKTSITPIKEGFTFLGIWFDRTEVQVGPEEKIRRFKKPLYITEPFVYLSLNGEAIEILKKRKVLQTIPLRRVSEIMVMEKASFSTALIKKCTEEDIPISLTLNTGYYITTIKPDNKAYYDLSYLHARHYVSLSEAERLAIAQEFAAGKLQNYRGMFHQKYVKGMHTFLSELDEAVDRIYQVGSLNEIRGLEGAATRKIYKNLNKLINNNAFHIKKRRRRPANRINSLLNFGYYLLFSRINATLRSVGLNPYLGFLHSPRNRYESLASDIQELFRPHIDRFVTRLLNLKIIQEEDFVSTDRGMYLNRKKVKTYLQRFEREMERKPKKENGPSFTLKQQIYAQVYVFKGWANGKETLTFYKWDL